MSCTVTDGAVTPRMHQNAGGSDSPPPVIRLATARLPTIYGNFDVTAYLDREGKEHLLVQIGQRDGKPPVVRLHSE